MGVPRFYGEWVAKQNFVGLSPNQVPPDVSSLSIDLNHLIHYAAGVVYHHNDPTSEEAKTAKLIFQQQGPNALFTQFFSVLTTSIITILNLAHPSDFLVLAIDGVVPTAKIQQQRQRRYRVSNSNRSKPVNEQPFFNSNVITPGTEFMTILADALRNWISLNRTILPQIIYFSDDKDPGEGEHKIMEYLREGYVIGDGSHVIYGLDADLIMLSMLLPLESQVMLLRADLSKTDPSRISAITLVDVGNLKTGIRTLLYTQSAIEDFVLMTCLIGNDFLPHGVPFLDSRNIGDSMNYLIAAYIKIRVPLTNGGNIIWQSLALYLTEVAVGEFERIANIDLRRVALLEPMLAKTIKIESVSKVTGTTSAGQVITSFREERVFDADQFRTLWYKNATCIKPTESEQALLLISGIDVELFTSPSLDSIVKMSQDYLSTLAWIMTYYQGGAKIINRDWFYPWYYCPLFIDLASISRQWQDNGIYLAGGGTSNRVPITIYH